MRIVSDNNDKHFKTRIEPPDESFVFCDFSVAGKRLVTEKVKANVEPNLKSSFKFYSSNLSEHLYYGTVSAVLESNNKKQILGFSFFNWIGHSISFPLTLYSQTHQPSGLLVLKIQSKSNPLPILKSIPYEGSHICILSSSLLPTPFHCFRFCRSLVNINCKIEAFCLHSLLACGFGHPFQVAQLLCSFFLGFGFESYAYSSGAIIKQTDEFWVWDLITGQEQHQKKLPFQFLIGYEAAFESPSQNPTIDSTWVKIDLPASFGPPALGIQHFDGEAKLECEIKKKLQQIRNHKTTIFYQRSESIIRNLIFLKFQSTILHQKSIFKNEINSLLRENENINLKIFNAFSVEEEEIMEIIQQRGSDILFSEETISFVFSLIVFEFAENIRETWFGFGSVYEPNNKSE
jgi:hypothetical protein